MVAVVGSHQPWKLHCLGKVLVACARFGDVALVHGVGVRVEMRAHLLGRLNGWRRANGR